MAAPDRERDRPEDIEDEEAEEENDMQRVRIVLPPAGEGRATPSQLQRRADLRRALVATGARVSIEGPVAAVAEYLDEALPQGAFRLISDATP